MPFSYWMLTTMVVAPPAGDEARVAAILSDCTVCHDASGDPSDPAGLNLDRSPRQLLGEKSVATGDLLVVPGKPDDSYLVKKLVGSAGIAGDPMPLGDEPLSEDQVGAVRSWIASLPADARPPAADTERPAPDAVVPGDRPAAQKRRGREAFWGTDQNVLPTTTTLGRNVLQYRIDHRFGRIGTERGAFGLDAGVIMSMALAYGIFDGWDVRLRRTNSRKGWELGTKYVPIRQEAGMPVSFGAYASVEFLRDFDVANEWTGNLMVMLSRLWFDRWATMLTFGYHFDTNHNSRVFVDLDDGQGPVLVRDRRDTLTIGLASTVYVDKKKRWGIDVEYFYPIASGRRPELFYYRGGDADPADLTQIGSWMLGGSVKVGLHFFQVFIANNREIHTNLAAAGGHSDNPFDTPGINPKNPFYEANFFLGFNLCRKFVF